MRITIFFGSYRKYWKNISSQLLHNIRRCWIEDKSKMLNFHFTIYLEGIEKLWRHVDLSIWRLESSLQRIETVSMINQPESRPSFFSFFFSLSFLFDYFQTISSNIFSTRKRRTRRALSRIFFVDGEYGFTTLKYFNDNVNSLDFHSCFFFFENILFILAFKSHVYIFRRSW